MVFAKIALWVMLSLAPVFIILLVFQMPSRFFSGWLTATIQVILVPIFLSTFLSFYILGVRGNMMTLYKVVSSHDDLPIMMKDAAPIVLICLAGLFLLAQIVPLAGRIASGTQEWATNALSQTGGARNPVNTIAGGRGLSPGRGPAGPPPGGQIGAANSSESALREIQDRNAAVKRQSRNR